MSRSKRKTLSILLLTVFLFTSTAGCAKKAQNPPATTPEIKAITSEELKSNLDNPEYVIVDLRPDEAYNGWQVDGISRGGHIKNAVQFTSSWLKEVKDSDLPQLLEEKGLKKDKKIVLYHSQKEETDKMAEKLTSLGYKEVYKFEELQKWADNDMPMESLPNYQILVYPEWVNKLIKGEKPATYQGKDFVILEASWGEASDAYNKGHIPGSFHFNTDNIETEPDWNLGPADKVKKSLEKFGISPDTTVVVYSEDVSAASRVVFALLWAGVKDVRLLNGGMKAWQDAGLKVETKENKPAPIADFGIKVPARPELSLPYPEDVLAKQKDPDFRLVSIRSWDEFTGKTSGYDYIEKAGEPKGAVWGHAGSDAYHMEDYLDPDGTLRNLYEIEKLWAEWDIKRHNEVSFYCGTGWRATVAWIVAHMLGWDKITIYDGGWLLWSKDPKNPVQIGDPRKK